MLSAICPAEMAAQAAALSHHGGNSLLVPEVPGVPLGDLGLPGGFGPAGAGTASAGRPGCRHHAPHSPGMALYYFCLRPEMKATFGLR